MIMRPKIDCKKFVKKIASTYFGIFIMLRSTRESLK
jgi:hypothetical protein